MICVAACACVCAHAKRGEEPGCLLIRLCCSQCVFVCVCVSTGSDVDCDWTFIHIFIKGGEKERDGEKVIESAREGEKELSRGGMIGRAVYNSCCKLLHCPQWLIG